MCIQQALRGVKDKLTNEHTHIHTVQVCSLVYKCFCNAAHASGLVSELIIAYLGINVRAGESNGHIIRVRIIGL